jgi:hypothetical protein
VSIRALAVAPVAAIAFFAAPALGQTLEERAAQVRQQIDPPPPAETVIDRGTRQIVQPVVPAATSTSPSGSTERRLTTEGVPPLAGVRRADEPAAQHRHARHARRPQ